MQSILITGCSSGIGLSTALTLARAGHTVYATMRTPSKGVELAQIALAEKLAIHISALDVDDEESVEEAIDAILGQAAYLDAVVNNAGVERMGALEDLSMDDFRACMETNYFGVLRVIRAVLPSMRARQSGAILNVASIAGRIAAAPQSAYAASKFALEAASEALAQEVKPFGIRVALIEPGIIDTPMARRAQVAGDSIYPQAARFANLFAASMARMSTPPSVVADKILEIIASDSWQFRHPVGPDAEPFLGWRASMNDEQWIAWGALSDDDWYAAVLRDFGLDARPKGK
jgi:NAD(P)-dependent dehydrogenase (short-subunit alcohol dehydrogenase family)